MDVVMELDVRNYFSFDYAQAKRMRKLAILPPVVVVPKKIVCMNCNGEGEVEIVETCCECDGSGWTDE